MQTVLPQKSSQDFEIVDIQKLLAEERKAVDGLIQQRLHSQVDLINQLGQYIVNSGGKRLRPLLVLLSARALSYQGKQHIDLATIIEFIHTATLLHDDVVDGSLLRRGNETANAIWGNQASVLVGDFLYSRAFQMMVGLNNMRVMDILSETTNTIAEGEVMQLLNAHNPDTTEESYMAVNRCKTAKLFEAASQLGAVIANAPPPIEAAMTTFGLHLGIAYQLIDDVLDYSASPEEMGKNIGDDLSEGKPTLPLIYAMRMGSKTQADLIRHAIKEGGLENINAVKSAIEATNAIAYTAQVAEREAAIARKALQNIPASNYREAMVGLLDFCTKRKY